MAYQNAKDYFGEDIAPVQDAKSYFGEEPPAPVPTKPVWQTPMDEMIMNVPKSFGNFVGSTVKGLGQMAQGLSNTDPFAPEKAVIDAVPAIARGLWEKYNSPEKIKKAIVEDPVGTAADLSIVFGKLDPTRAVTAPIKAGAKAVTESLPKWAYKSSVKMGTGKALSVAERNQRAVTGLENAIMPTEGGLARLENKISAIEDAIQTPINEAAQRGVTIPREAVARRLEGTLDKFSKQVNPLDDLNAIANVEKGFVETQPSRIPIDVGQELKKGTYQQLKGKYGKLSGAAIESEKALARGLKEEVYSALEASHPELKALGEKEGSLIALKDSIESAVKRIQNQEAIGLGMPAGAGAGYAMGGSTGAATAGFLAKALELPRVKSALAIALFKAGQKAKKLGGTPSAIAGTFPPYAYASGRYLGEEE